MKNRLILGIWLWAALAGPPPLWPQAPDQGQADDRELADFFLEAAEGAQPETPPAQPPATASPASVPALPPEAKPADPFALPSAPAAPQEKESPPSISGPVSPPADSPWIQLEIGQGDQPTAALPSLPPPALAPAPAAAGPAVPAVPTSVPAVPLPEPAPAQTPQGWRPSQQERLRSVFSDMLPPESATSPSPAPPPPAGPAPAPASAPAAPLENEGASAILKSGGLISIEDYVGAAEILPPLTGRRPRPQAELPPNVTPASPVRPRAETPASAPRPAAAPAPENTAGGQTKNKKRRAAASSARPAAGVSLIIINETGQPRIGEQYRSVLTQMGYRVLSVGNGPAVGGGGQTVIKYRPGSRAGAQAVARHLPGRKVLVAAESGQVLASEIMVHLK